LFSELSDYFGIAVRFQKRQRKWQPLAGRYRSHHVEQENEQIIRLTCSSRERFLMDDFKINQSRAITRRIVDHILASAITVGPTASKLVAPKLVGAAKLGGGGLQHPSRERPAIQMLP